MKHLVKNLKTLCFSDDSKNLLRDSIAERLSDDSPLVLLEALRFSTGDLQKILDANQLVDKLVLILSHGSPHDDKWFHTTELALGHITSPLLWTERNNADIFLAVWPFLFPLNHCDLTLMQQLLASPYAENHVPFLRMCRTESTAAGLDDVNQHIQAQIKLRRGMPDIVDVIASIQSIPDKRFTIRRAYFSVFLLSQMLPDNCSASIAGDVLKQMLRVTRLHKHKITFVETTIPNSYAYHAACQSYPLQTNLLCINAIVDCTVRFAASAIDFSAPSPLLSVMVDVFRFILDGIWYGDNSNHTNRLYNIELRSFFETVLPTFTEKMEFLSHFYAVHAIDATTSSIRIPVAFQIQSMRTLNALLERYRDTEQTVTMTVLPLVRIIYGLTADTAAIRQVTLETLEMLATLPELPADYATLIQKLLNRKEELRLDANQLSLILVRIFCAAKSTKRLLRPMMDELFAYVAEPKSNRMVQAIVLDMFKHINNDIDVLRKIAATPLRIVQEAAARSGGRLLCLNQYESQIVRLTLFRFNVDTVVALKSPASSACWTFVVNCIRSHNIMLTAPSGGDDGSPLSTSAMDIFGVEFFASLNDQQRTEIIKEVVLVSATLTQNTDVLVGASKLMARLPIDARAHLDLFDGMRTVDVTTTATDEVNKQLVAAKKLRKSGGGIVALSTDIIATVEWRCGVAMLEYLQTKTELRNAHLLLPKLFAVLKRCLQFDDQSLVEYTKQLVLGCMLLCCRLISPQGVAKRDLIPDKVFEIELVVECIRGTQNPQTHHHALQLLSYTAAMIPESVLQNMMNIFTFVGSSVVRRDDAYTYQVISNIIRSIIPTLIRSQAGRAEDQQHEAVLPVLRVFADIILDVPEHRRLRLYEDLLNTLGARQYLWMFLAALFESHVRNFNKDSGAAGNGGAAAARRDDPQHQKRIDVALEITNQFDCACVLETCSRLIDFLHKQPAQKDEKSNGDGDGGGGGSGGGVGGDQMDITDTSLFNVRNYTNYQLRYFKYTTLQFVIRLTERTSRFVVKVAGLDADATAALKPQFKQIIVTILQFIGRSVRLAAAQNAEKFWKVVLTNCYDILDQVLALIYPDMLLQVVSGLLNKNNIPEVRRKAIELLNKKLQLTHFFANCEQETLLALLGELFLFCFISFI